MELLQKPPGAGDRIQVKVLLVFTGGIDLHILSLNPSIPSNAGSCKEAILVKNASSSLQLLNDIDICRYTYIHRHNISEASRYRLTGLILMRCCCCCCCCSDRHIDFPCTIVEASKKTAEPVVLAERSFFCSVSRFTTSHPMS